MSTERVNLPLKLANDKPSPLIRGGMRQSRPLEAKITPRTSIRKSRTSRTSFNSGKNEVLTNQPSQQGTNILNLHTTTSFRLPARTSYIFLYIFNIIILILSIY